MSFEKDVVKEKAKFWGRGCRPKSSLIDIYELPGPTFNVTMSFITYAKFAAIKCIKKSKIGVGLIEKYVTGVFSNMKFVKVKMYG